MAMALAEIWLIAPERMVSTKPSPRATARCSAKARTADFVAGADLGGAGRQHQRGLALPGDRLEPRGDRDQRAVALDEVVDRSGGLRVLPALGKIAASPAERSSSTEP